MAMQPGSDKHGSLQDDYLKQETEGLERAERENRAEEWRQQQAPGEDEPEVDRVPDGMYTGGAPAGMEPGDVEGRSEIARFLGTSSFPAVREMLIDDVMKSNAPQHVIDAVKNLPAGREFRNVQEVWETLGGGVERRRS